MNGIDGQALQNVLSVSTAANNRYLFHFNSLHSLTQWTAGIRLAMYEQATLQEAYTGSILAGKGRHLNGIKTIMERTRFPTEDWVRVRFGAGTPWRRCWCVITPPDEKQFQKAQKDAKKKSAYERSAPTIKGDIKFYDTRKVTKKSTPIATVTDAFAAYALYPQSKNLIDQSTLIKVEGIITIHTTPDTTTEGFVFVMPEVHPAISGFEIMLRWLMPTYDTFALYGRPNRLVADVIDTRSLMFAMPPAPSRYGYLELIDVAGLIHGEGSTSWNEREWRKQMKLLTSKRMTSGPSSANRSESDVGSRTPASRSSLNLQTGTSKSSLNLPPTRTGVKFGDQPNGRSAPGSRQGSPALDGGFGPPPRTETAPPASGAPFSSPHKRVASDRIYNRPVEPSRLSFETHRDDDNPPAPPPHGHPEHWRSAGQGRSFEADRAGPRYQDYGQSEPYHNGYAAQQPPVEHVPNNKLAPYNPVAAPPAMAHKGGQRPPVRPNQMPDLRRANSAIDAATLAQIADANRVQRARSSSGAQDDASMSMQQPPSGAAVMAPMGNPNYAPDPAAYSRKPPPSGHPPMQMRMGPPQPGYPNQRGPPPPAHSSQSMGQSRLATIPGTPAFEQNNFDLPPQNQPNQGGRPGQGQGTLRRKPIPERQDSYGYSRGQPPPTY